MDRGIIYKITNNINDKCYIGKTIFTFKQRYPKGFKSIQNKHLKNAINKYGEENFTISILEKGIDDEQKLFELEKRYIKEFQSNNPSYGYNKDSGGKGSDNWSYMPKEQKERLQKEFSKRFSGKNNPMWNKNWKEFADEETIKNHCKNVSDAIRRRYEKEENRLKTSEAMKKVWANPDFYQKMCEKQKGGNNNRAIKIIAISPDGGTYKFDCIKDASEQLSFIKSIIASKIRNNDETPYQISPKSRGDIEKMKSMNGWIFKRI